MASIAVVENAGEATVIAASEVSNGAYCTPKQSSFSRSVKNIRDVVGPQDITKSATPPLAAELQEESNAFNSKPPPSSVTEDVVVPDLGVISNPAILAENQSTIGRGDTSTKEITSEISRGIVSKIDTPKALLSAGVKPASLQNGVTKIQTSETEGLLDTVISDTTPAEVGSHRSDIEDIGNPKVDISATRIESDMVPAEIVQANGIKSEIEQRDLGDRLPPIARMIGDCPSESMVGSTPLQNHQSFFEVAVDPNLPGVRGQVVRRFMELEDKYARTLRQQGKFPLLPKYVDLLSC